MTLEELVFAAFRVAVSLPVLAWPLAGGLLSAGGDFADLLVREYVDLGGIGDYQALDKVLDQFSILLFLVVSLRWQGIERRVAIAMYVYRLVGFALFMVTGDRSILMLFPNVFEFWFLLVALLHHWSRPIRWTRPWLVVALVGVTALKLAHEWVIHVGQLLDRITVAQFFEMVWQALTGPW